MYCENMLITTDVRANSTSEICAPPFYHKLVGTIECNIASVFSNKPIPCSYPDPGRFYAEENFIGGLMERPVHPAPPTPAAAAAGSSTVAAVQK